MERKDTHEFLKEVAATRSAKASISTLLHGLEQRIRKAAEAGDMREVLAVAGEMRTAHKDMVEAISANTLLASKDPEEGWGKDQADAGKGLEKPTADEFGERGGIYGSQGPSPDGAYVGDGRVAEAQLSDPASSDQVGVHHTADPGLSGAPGLRPAPSSA